MLVVLVPVFHLLVQAEIDLRDIVPDSGAY